MRLWLAILSAALFVVVVATGVGMTRIAQLAGGELDVVERVTLREAGAHDGATSDSAPLASVRLEREHDVTFELCADDPMRPERWAGALAIAIWRPRAQELMTRTELTPGVLGLVRRNDRQGCLQIGSGTIGASDEYAIEALWDTRPEALADVPLYVRVSASHPLARTDALLVLFAWLGSLAVVLALLVRTRPAPSAAAHELEAAPYRASSPPVEAEPRRPVRPEVRAVAGLVLVLTAFFASGWLPDGPGLGLGIAILLAGIEAGAAFGLAPAGRRLATLALERAKGWWWHVPLAVVGGVVLGIVAQLATQLVPSTSESAIQSFVSWPSGMLSFALLAVIAPLAEEIFFRGFVYGILRERSAVLAFLGAWLLFVLAHVPQTFGQWGALVAIAVMGLGLTAMRALSGSALIPALAHLTYNGLIALRAVLES